MADSITVKAVTSNLETINEFIHSKLTNCNCDNKTLMNIDLSVEELFVNIASYAYPDSEGEVVTECWIDKESSVNIRFIDEGVPFNPLNKTDPDIHATAEERKIGGLGIFLTKKLMDNVVYNYADGKNQITITKKIPFKS